MCLGDLSAADFGHITEVACDLAHRCCGGRVLSVLEGGYGVPCCRSQKEQFLSPKSEGEAPTPRPQPSKLMDLDLPDDMDDQVPYALQRRLEKCHAEGFVECVAAHVEALIRGNSMTSN